MNILTPPTHPNTFAIANLLQSRDDDRLTEATNSYGEAMGHLNLWYFTHHLHELDKTIESLQEAVEVLDEITRQNSVTRYWRVTIHQALLAAQDERDEYA